MRRIVNQEGGLPGFDAPIDRVRPPSLRDAVNERG